MYSTMYLLIYLVYTTLPGTCNCRVPIRIWQLKSEKPEFIYKKKHLKMDFHKRIFTAVQRSNKINQEAML